MAQRFRVAMVAAECVPFVKVGGLADVIDALSRAVAHVGCSVALFLPRYERLELPEGSDLELASQIDVPVGEDRKPCQVYRLVGGAGRSQIHRFFLANEEYFGRTGIYDDPATGEAYGDNAERFIFLARAALEAMRAVAFVPEVIHANDHQTALVPVYLKTLLAEDAFFQMTATVLAIHNLGYQGIYPAETMRVAGFPDDFLYPLSPFEFWGRMNCLKAGIHFADRIVTVSERYAEEIQSGEEFGFGLQGVLNARRTDLLGILNGIDVRAWNPRTDRHLLARFDADALGGKELCKRALLKAHGLAPDPAWPLIGIISRLVDQKGFDLFEAASEALLALPARWIVLGTGVPRYEALFERLARTHPDRLAFRRGFDEPLAHRIEGGSDFFLMPSRYEPCGLNQMMSMRYGTVPVVRAVGGLAETVEPVGDEGRAGTGILFTPYTPEALVDAVGRALALYDDARSLEQVRRRGMSRDFSWEAAARRYIQLYKEANAARRMGHGFHRWLEGVEEGFADPRPSGGWTPPGPPLTRRRDDG